MMPFVGITSGSGNWVEILANGGFVQTRIARIVFVARPAVLNGLRLDGFGEWLVERASTRDGDWCVGSPKRSGSPK